MTEHPESHCVTAHPERTYRVVREWSIANGGYVYAVYETTRPKNAPAQTHRYEGGREWAEKNAKHFGVEIEESISED